MVGLKLNHARRVLLQRNYISDITARTEEIMVYSIKLNREKSHGNNSGKESERPGEKISTKIISALNEQSE